jgi:hypothetical protein
MNLPPEEIAQELVALHGRLGESNGWGCFDSLLKLLDDHGCSWGLCLFGRAVFKL